MGDRLLREVKMEDKLVFIVVSTEMLIQGNWWEN